jgi:hypothetical protein
MVLPIDGDIFLMEHPPIKHLPDQLLLLLLLRFYDEQALQLNMQESLSEIYQSQIIM